MANFYDYLKLNGNVNLSKNTLNEVDIAILSMLSYLDWSGIVPENNPNLIVSINDACKSYLSDIDFKQNKKNVYAFNTPRIEKMLKLLVTAERFGSIKMCLFKQDTDYLVGRQFAALTFCINDSTIENIVAFRGTDSTLIGWKEDFELAYMKSIPAQKSAAKYLHMSMNKLHGKFAVCGHSKGGNLAVYSAARARHRHLGRIIKIYNFDGPGFEFTFTDKKLFKKCEEKVINYIPQESVVGMILEPVGKRLVIQSKGRGFIQHDAFFWKIDKTTFLRGELTDISKITDYILSEWLNDMSIEERENFVTSIFDLFGAEEGNAFSREPIYNMKLIIRTMQKYSKIDADTKELINKIMGNLRKSAQVRIKSTIKSKMPISTEK